MFFFTYIEKKTFIRKFRYDCDFKRFKLNVINNIPSSPNGLNRRICVIKKGENLLFTNNCVKILFAKISGYEPLPQTLSL